MTGFAHLHNRAGSAGSTRYATAVRDGVRRRPFLAYVVVAYAISWTYWISMAIRGEVVTPGGDVSHFPGFLGPLVAAFVVSALVGGRPGVRDLLGRMSRWRVGVGWYLVAAVPFLLFLAGVGLEALTGGETPTLAQLGRFSGLPELGLPLVLVLALAVNCFGEEIGWRGFALPSALARFGPLGASLAVAVVWAIWHVPSFFVIETYREAGLELVPMFAIALPAGSVVLTWVYRGSGGSILIVALWHLALNMGSATEAGRGLPQAFVSTGIVVWAALIAIAWARAGRRTADGRTADGRTAERKPRMTPWTRLVTTILGSPFHALLGGGLLLIAYRGRRTGRPLSTPVEFVRDGERLTVLVAKADAKQWWRNVREEPAIRVRLGGDTRTGRAAVEMPGEAAFVEDLGRYLARKPRAGRAVAGGSSVIVRIDLDPAPAR